MKISVVTVSYNAARTIGQTVRSFLAQTHLNKELIVIDGSSTDDTVAVVRALADPSITVTSEPDAGMYDAANKGLARFNGDAVGFLNADDRFHDGSVLTAIADAFDQTDIVFGNIDMVADHVTGRVVRRWRASPFRKGSFRRGWMPPHPSFYVRRAVVDAVGQYDLRYRLAADYDWMLRACELNAFRMRLLDRTVVDMALGGMSTRSLSAYVRHNLEALKSRQQWLGSGGVDTALLVKPARKLGQRLAR